MSDGKQAYKFEPHHFERRAAGKQYCSYCGLFALNNSFSEWSMRVGCNHRDHPQYASKRYDTTKLPF